MNNQYEIKKASLTILEKDAKILMIRRYNTGFADGLYTLPSGKVELNETFAQAAIRETLEEVNAKIKFSNLESVLIMFEKTKDIEWIHHFFLCKEWEGKIQNMEVNKCDDIDWFDINNLPENTLAFVKDAIKKIYFDKQHYCEYGHP
ncbi:NUDIX domain-containing protein [bacterium]|nr:NUDIX domain-containing protein [bacterium]